MRPRYDALSGPMGRYGCRLKGAVKPSNTVSVSSFKLLDLRYLQISALVLRPLSIGSSLLIRSWASKNIYMLAFVSSIYLLFPFSSSHLIFLL